MTSVAGTDRREHQASLLEPLELEDLDGPNEEDPSVFDRITAVPGDLPTLVPAASAPLPPPEPPSAAPTRPGSTPPASSVTAAPQTPASRPERDSDPPPVFGAPVASSGRPRRRPSRPPRTPSRPSLERSGRRPSTPRQTAVEIELELVDVNAERPAMAYPDALEADLPLQQPIGLASSSPPPSDPDVIDMKDRYATGDFSGALVIAESILEALPAHEEALRCQVRCTEVLSQMYLARLGSLRQVVQVALSAEQIRWLSLDHRAGFLLSMIDGTSSIEELLDVSSMPRLDALRILYGLLDQRVIALSG